MERNFEYEYPYGKFPTKFTKSGQQKYFEELTNGDRISTQSYSQPDPAPAAETQQNSFDISKLLPLLKLMGNKKGMNSTDMLKVMLPLLGGNDSQLSDLMSLFYSPQKDEEKEEDIEISSSPKIDEYVRVD